MDRIFLGRYLLDLSWLLFIYGIEVRTSDRMGKKWLLTLKSCVSYAADHTEMRSSDGW